MVVPDGLTLPGTNLPKVTAAGWPYETNWQMAKGRHHLVMKGGGMQSDLVEFEVR